MTRTLTAPAPSLVYVGDLKDLVRQSAGHAITGHPRAVSVLIRRADWPWCDDYAPLDAPSHLPQGSHDAFISPTLGCTYIGFTVPREGACQ